MESDKNYLVTSPKDITKTNKQKIDIVSPISSETNPFVSIVLKDSLGIDFAALKSLYLYRDY